MSDNILKPADELHHLEDALIQCVLECSAEEIRTDLIEAGCDPDAMIAKSKSISADAASLLANARLIKAKRDAESFRNRMLLRNRPRSSVHSPHNLSKPGLLLAARKGGGGVSDTDKNALSDALAELEALEAQEDTE